MTKVELLRRMLIVTAAGGILACGLIAGIDDYHIGDCKGGNCLPDTSTVTPPPQVTDAATPVADTGVPCTGVQSPPSIRVGSDTNTFCIDTTEVTVGAYNAFLEAGVPTSSQTGVCQWNTDYTPARTPAEIEAGPPPDDFPVTDVDWCDAFAFCQWAGKYLCGRVDNGHKIGPVTEDGLSDYHSHQWMLACSAEARLRYPYGGLFDPTKCNLAEFDAGGLIEAGSAPGCVGGYQGLHDMVGNAWEWFDGPCEADGGTKPDAAEGPEGDSCIIKGGAYDNSGASFDCRFDLTGIRRDFHGANVGFRCCSD